MDKQTLSNYGWVIITVLVLAVMIALATPFGTYVKDAVWSTANGLFATEDVAMNKVMDGMSPPTTDELQRRYDFKYYSSFTKAIDDVNNNTIGDNQDANKDNAVAGVYIGKDGTPNVVLLQDTATNSRTYVTSSATINLGGNTLTCNTNVGITNEVNTNGILTIDGQLEGSTITVTGKNGNARVFQCSTGKMNIIGGTYIASTSDDASVCIFYDVSTTGIIEDCKVIATSESNMAYSIYAQTGAILTVKNCNITTTSKDNTAVCIMSGDSTTATVENCTTVSQSENGATRGININKNATGTIKNCNVTTTSKNKKAYGVYVGTSSTVAVHNCKIVSYADYASTSDNSYTSLSSAIAINNGASVDIKNCYAKGVFSAIEAKGSIDVDGGTYEGYGHGGFYVSGAGTTSRIKNATIKQCAMPDGYVDISGGCNNAAGYIGGSVNKDNIKVYMDNCDIQSKSVAIVLRGGANGEKNNSLYISNSRISDNTKFRIDNNTHELYIGIGNNFTAENTTSPDDCTITNETYGE